MKAEFPVNAVRLCIDGGSENLRGRICATTLEQDLIFESPEELIMQVEKAYDLIGRPQPHQVMRSIRREASDYNSYVGNPKRFHSSEEIRRRTGKLYTCDLVMVSRRHAEWQGILKLTDGRVIGQFNSVLEFIKLLGKQFERSKER